MHSLPLRNSSRLALTLAAALAWAAGARGGVVLDMNNTPASASAHLSIHPAGATSGSQEFSDFGVGTIDGITYAVEHGIEDGDAQLLAAGAINVHSATARDAAGNFVGLTQTAGASAAAHATTNGGQAADSAYATASFDALQTLVFEVPNDGSTYVYSLAATASAEGGGAFFGATLGYGNGRPGQPNAPTPLPPLVDFVVKTSPTVATAAGEVHAGNRIEPGEYNLALASIVGVTAQRAGSQPRESAAQFVGRVDFAIDRAVLAPTVATVAADAPYSTVSVPAAMAGAPPAAALLGGTAGAGGRDVTLAVVAPLAGTAAAGVIGNPVRLTGTGADQVVLSVGYDDAGLLPEAEAALYLAWLDPSSGAWVNAVAGNTGGTPQAFAESYADYLARDADGGAPALGAFGVDTAGNTVWAVINHNSLFGAGGAPAISTVPEPLAALGGVGLVAALSQRRTRRPA